MHQFVRHLVTEWRRLDLPFAGGTVVVAVSGGTDSNSLLIALNDLAKREKFGHRIVAAHFNHRFRGAESDADEEYIKRLCGSLNIELAIGHAKIDGEANLEEKARHARYQFLTETAKNLGAFAVMTAHTVNDQAETFLINLIRGSGPKGLSGMRPVREMQHLSERESVNGDDQSPELPFAVSPRLLLVRPLLRWAKRKQTEGFCADLNVECRHDAMNDDTAFRRVRIRKVLLPLLQDFNPKIVETLAQTAELMAETVDAVPESAAVDTSKEFLLLADLRSMGKREMSATLRRWLEARRGTSRSLQLKHIEAIGSLMSSEKSGKTAELPGGAMVVKENGRLTFQEKKVEN